MNRDDQEAVELTRSDIKCLDPEIFLSSAVINFCHLEKNALRAGVNQPFTIAHSHYGDNIDLENMSHDYVPGYEVRELEEMEAVVAPLSQDLMNRIEGIVLPRRG